jgi:aspartyl-tRNA(Asn)/glutamyl-tRNA(Gln) amidotransferase subunit C
MPSAGRETIDEATVSRLASLAKLDLSDAERAGLAEDLSRIVAYVDQLAELPLDGVPATAHLAFHDQAALRSDEPRECLPRELVLAGAPRSEDDGFAVPTFVDEG